MSVGVGLEKGIGLGQDGAEAHQSLFDLMGPSSAVRHLDLQIRQVAPTNFTVIVQGDTGAGKELVARFLHVYSKRASKPFIAVDCGAFTETIIESDLFGHVKGAFTGAVHKRLGCFELAKGGTLFLDEIANLALPTQRKLLRSVQERRILPLGGERQVPVDFRLLVASHADVAAEVQAGRFRQDLFHRLNEFTIYVPPLRERKDDIPFLAERFRAEANAELQREIAQFSPAAYDYLLSHAWPGNVRELRNAVRRAVLLSTEVIEPKHLCQPSPRRVSLPAPALNMLGRETMQARAVRRSLSR
jgi:two-component system nitrogen regulation response regulator GlnG